jgi:hypothetical protein
MFMLRERVGSLTYKCDYGTAFDVLVSRLSSHQINVEKKDKTRGEVVARCLTKPLEMLVWRCWSDKLLFRFIEKGGETAVDVYAVPNLLRLRIGRDDRTVDLEQLLSQLS